MTALLLFGCALALALVAPRWPVAVAGAVLLAAWAGTTFPDVDQLLPLGGHRSALSHSVLPALLAAWRREARAAAAGLGFGTGLHLSADLFPNAMVGYALVKVPLLGGLSAGASYLWFAVHALAAFALGAWLLGRLVEARLAALVLAGVAAIGLVYLFSTDGGWPPLAIFAATAWLAFRRRGRASLGTP